MKKLITTIVLIVIGIFMIPALFAMGIGLFGTVLGFMAEPRVMMVLIGVLAIFSIPGMIIMFIAKR